MQKSQIAALHVLENSEPAIFWGKYPLNQGPSFLDSKVTFLQRAISNYICYLPGPRHLDSLPKWQSQDFQILSFFLTLHHQCSFPKAHLNFANLGRKSKFPAPHSTYLQIYPPRSLRKSLQDHYLKTREQLEVTHHFLPENRFSGNDKT